MINDKTIQEIMSTAKVEEVVEDYVTLKRRGVNLIGLCPFHNEKTPSFTVSPAKNFYKCFGCGKGGSSITFLMEHESLTYPEALRFLAQKYNITIEEEARDDEYLAEQQKKESLLLINQFALDYFQKELMETQEGRAIGLSYFKHRGLLETTIATFGLGYAPKHGQAFSDLAREKGYNVDSLKELGLIGRSDRDFFRERVIFPFYNLSGKVIGFGGRILNDAIKTAKYLNSPESEIYNKRKTLYGLFQARSEIRKQDFCILVEGYTDVLSLYQNGLKNVVASSGTSLTTDQVRLIKRFTENVRVIYDGDQAGQNAALRSLDIFLEYGLNIEVVVLPENQDPDSFMTQVGTTAFKAFMEEHKKDFIILLAKNIQDEFAHDPVKKSIHIRDLITSLAKITDQIKRSLYIKECAVILQVDETSILREVNKSIRTDIAKRKHLPVRNIPERIGDEDKQDHSQGIRNVAEHVQYQELDVVRVLLQGGHLAYDDSENHTVGEYIISNIIQIIDLFESALYRKIIEEYADLLSQNIYPAQENFLYHDDQEIRNLCMEVLMDPYHYANWSIKGVELQTQKPKEENYQKDSFQAILRFKLKKVNQRIDEIEKLIVEGNHGQLEALLRAKIKLQEERRTLADEQGTIVL